MEDIEVGVTFRTLKGLGVVSSSWVMLMLDKNKERQHVARVFLLNPPYVIFLLEFSLSFLFYL
jgi:hypothetical protein